MFQEKEKLKKVKPSRKIDGCVKKTSNLEHLTFLEIFYFPFLLIDKLRPFVLEKLNNVKGKYNSSLCQPNVHLSYIL